MKDSIVFLDHIIESIDLVGSYLKGHNLESFRKSIQLQDCCIRRLEIIGEAVKNLPDEVKAKNSKLPWRKIAGMRDLLIHKYFGVDIELTWRVLTKELPILRSNVVKLRKLLASAKKSD
jgi:uncharacterized protein with HEPN domain